MVLLPKDPETLDVKYSQENVLISLLVFKFCYYETATTS